MHVNRRPKILMSLTVLFFLLGLAAAQVAAVEVFGTVTCDEVSLRVGAGSKYQQITTAVRGEDLRLNGRNADASWLRVSIFSNRRNAWVNASCISTTYNVNLLETPVATGVNSGFVNTKALNLRKGPGANFDVIITLNIRDIFDITGQCRQQLGQGQADQWHNRLAKHTLCRAESGHQQFPGRESDRHCRRSARSAARQQSGRGLPDG
jgi:uncharacterized protein YgiM (DUF1202 family)